MNEVMKRILLYAESSLHPAQFKAFRRLVMDEMGRSGMEGKLKEIFGRLGNRGRREGESDARRSDQMA